MQKTCLGLSTRARRRLRCPPPASPTSCCHGAAELGYERRDIAAFLEVLEPIAERAAPEPA